MADTRLLRHFLAVFQHRNMTAAAGALHITQPALTKSIRRLEEELDVHLFDRLPSGMEPTRYGHILARRAKLMDLELRHGLAEIRAMKDGTGGVLRIAGGPAWNFAILPRAFAKFSRLRPHVMVRLRSGITAELIPELLNGELDLLFGALDNPVSPEIEQQRFLDFDYIVVAGQDHPLAARAIVEPRDLVPYPWVAPLHDHATISSVTSFFIERGLEPPRFTYETGSYANLLATLRQTDLLAIIVAPVLEQARAFGACQLPISESIRRFPAGVLYRRSSSHAPSSELFVETVHAACQELSASPHS